MFGKYRMIALNNHEVLRKELLPFLEMVGGKHIHLKCIPDTNTRVVTAKLKLDDWAFIVDFFSKKYPELPMTFMTLGR